MTYPFYLLHEVLGENALGILSRLCVPASLIIVGIVSWIVVSVLEPPTRNALRLALGLLNNVSCCTRGP